MQNPSFLIPPTFCANTRQEYCPFLLGIVKIFSKKISNDLITDNSSVIALTGLLYRIPSKYQHICKQTMKSQRFFCFYLSLKHYLEWETRTFYTALVLHLIKNIRGTLPFCRQTGIIYNASGTSAETTYSSVHNNFMQINKRMFIEDSLLLVYTTFAFRRCSIRLHLSGTGKKQLPQNRKMVTEAVTKKSKALKNLNGFWNWTHEQCRWLGKTAILL